MDTSPQDCAADLLEVVPLIMRGVRAEVRRDRTPELSMPQFRALSFVERHEGSTLTEVAQFLGLTLPTASKMMDGLVDAGYVQRAPDRRDRRKIKLHLSTEGQQIHEAILLQAREFLASRLQHLDPNILGDIRTSLRVLRTVFEPVSVPGEAVGAA
ncbi:MarR family transcriptional regulator [Verrucomicrobium sp. BvORR034]|uniref:MarR family winged helix-turn-helix transcriptional regulator n=1 Tax=Verrucomicrobium sp. BvORR034 TaxID=1396418 RepID=UPI000679B1F6|nr:MarR family transcriptional regulator [Verrucomicrobium sp. BvORR034]